MPILFIIVFLIKKKRDRYGENHDLYLKEVAYKNFQKNFAKIKLGASDQQFFESLSKTVREYIGHKVSIDGMAMTPIDVSRHLQERNVSDKIYERISSILKECESGQYGGISLGEAEKKKMLSMSKSAVAKLEKELKK